MALNSQEALIYLMTVTAVAHGGASDRELGRMMALIERLPIFKGFDLSRLEHVANDCANMINGAPGLEGALDFAVAALPHRLHDTAYAVTVEIATVDVKLEQEELRLLEMIRDRLDLDRLVTAAIEAAARALLRRA